ncbi:trypsin-like peptidase domain-containing protein [Mucilaginibacter mali]|uniref:Trypsin-like peptidase domain-containing protein n=1 Tax=Mucilaginibacter mali TaxID=2740462 RepID=A0A7D4UFC9_9SPHI|nr:trypsin-like peptidase domain-containing protein [Mucilaginibacter mali]QKJ32599.1 trypsin-like peptidase domain-containing protein [Mucilaginibacter mali]
MKNKQIITALSTATMLLLNTIAFSQAKELEKFTRQVQEVIKKAAPATVFLADYDPQKKILTNELFSGVVVSKDGLILTAAHVCFPNKTYIVIFSDGTERTATGLGRMQSVDAAIMKINEPGNYPSAPIGWSSSLKVNEPCISIAYPGSFNTNTINTPPAKPKRQVVRLGYVAEPLTRRGTRIRTTCLMEPGDSGGPVFDMYGRVVGLHSSINMPVTDNMEIPVDLYRKYWTALNKPEDYKAMPAEDLVPVDSLRMGEKNFIGIAKLDSTFGGLKSKYTDYSLLVKSVNKGKPLSILGTAVSLDGLAAKNLLKGKGFLVTKNSMLGDSIQVQLPDGKMVAGKIISRDNNSDLALVQIDTKLKNTIDIYSLKADSITNDQLGTLLLSAEPAKTGVVSVLASAEFPLKNFSSIGYLGGGTANKNGKLVMNMVQPNTAAMEFLKVDDEITSIDGQKLSTPDDFLKAIQKHKPGEVAVVNGSRDNNAFSYNITLRLRPPANSTHIASRFEGGRSERYDGFWDTFVHDAVIKPSECGGPVFDSNGRFIGINMARYSRVSSIATAARGVQKFVETSARSLSNTQI